MSPRCRATRACTAQSRESFSTPARCRTERAWLATGRSENYDNFNDPETTAALEQARGTANPDQRAARAEELTMQQPPWIPDVEPDTVLVLGQGLSGAVSSSAYLFTPWANQLGGTG